MEKKKVLFVATVVRTHIMPFHLPYLKWFHEQGYETHVCARNDYNEKRLCKIPHTTHFWDTPFSRFPFSIKNIFAFFKVRSLIRRHRYTLIHCHTPIGGVVGRLAATRARKKGTRVLYTAHGFHFYTDPDGRLHGLMFAGIEKWLAKFTDCLVTINREDYDYALAHRFAAKRIEHVHGVGVNIQAFSPVGPDEKTKHRRTRGFDDNDFLLLYTAEFTERKNHAFLLDVFERLAERIPNAKLLLAGSGRTQEACRLRVQSMPDPSRVIFLGFRNDIAKWMRLADVAVSVSLFEGLPVHLMEAMATGIAVVATDCRGNRDLIEHEQNGLTVRVGDTDAFVNALFRLYESDSLRATFANNARQKIPDYSIDTALMYMSRIYSEWCDLKTKSHT